jgi:predicted secreted protein/putative hemolysin
MTSSGHGGRGIIGLSGLGIILVLLLMVSGCTQQVPVNATQTPAPAQTTTGMPNPASVSCGLAGGTVEIKKISSGDEYGMCTFRNGTSCEEWALFRGEGCKPGLTITPEPGGKRMFTLTETDNGKSAEITQNTRFAIVLAENPTTGFMWNASLSPGLELQSSDYRQDDAAPGMVGVGGERTWIIVAKDTGNQKFSAIYRRSWENVTGNEKTYSVTVTVVKA